MCWVAMVSEVRIHHKRRGRENASDKCIFGSDKFDVHRAVHRNIISVVKPIRCTNVANFILFCKDAVHVSDGLSVHHQEFKTVHTATGICQTDTAVCLLASRQLYLLLYVQS